MYIKLIGVLAIEERHRRASLWAQPSVSETDTPNLAPVPSTQPQHSPLNSSVANMNPSPIASSQCQVTTTDTPNLAPVPTTVLFRPNVHVTRHTRKKLFFFICLKSKQNLSAISGEFFPKIVNTWSK